MPLIQTIKNSLCYGTLTQSCLAGGYSLRDSRSTPDRAGRPHPPHLADHRPWPTRPSPTTSARPRDGSEGRATAGACRVSADGPSSVVTRRELGSRDGIDDQLAHRMARAGPASAPRRPVRRGRSRGPRRPRAGRASAGRAVHATGAVRGVRRVPTGPSWRGSSFDLARGAGLWANCSRPPPRERPESIAVPTKSLVAGLVCRGPQVVDGHADHMLWFLAVSHRRGFLDQRPILHDGGGLVGVARVPQFLTTCLEPPLLCARHRPGWPRTGG